MFESNNNSINPALPKDQYWLIKTMRSLGLDAYREGVCAGLTPTAILFFLTGEFTEFHKQLFLVYSIYRESLDEAKKRFKISSEEYLSLEYTDYILKDIEQQKSLEALRDGLQKIIPEKFSQLSQNIKDELNDFLKAIQRYFEKQIKQVTFFTEDETEIEPLFLEKVKMVGGIHEIASSSGKYNINKAEEFFKSLRLQIADTSLPIGMSLSCSKLKEGYLYHVIGVMYDPTRTCWLFVDPNELPSIEVYDENLLAKKVIAAFTKYDIVSFNLSIHATGNSKAILQKCLTSWEQQQILADLKRVNIIEGSFKDYYLDETLQLLRMMPNAKKNYELTRSYFEKAWLSYQEILKLEVDPDAFLKEKKIYQSLQGWFFNGSFIRAYSANIKNNPVLLDIIDRGISENEDACKAYSNAKNSQERLAIVSKFSALLSDWEDNFEKVVGQKPENKNISSSYFSFFYLPSIATTIQKGKELITSITDYYTNKKK